jgi:hypothetical protein
MKLPQTFLVCLCLLGATQLALSQVKEPAAHTIPGYLDPATGKFTTRIAPAATASKDAQAEVTGTSIFFREDFQISVANYDQPGSTAVCSVSMASSGDADYYYDYEDEASVPATPTGGGFSCDVPVLTLWTLQTPTSDTITASVTVTIYSQTTPVPIYRSSTQSLSLAQPGNAQTVVNTVHFQI